ncbi:MAG: tRNA (adenosine(37)-N6)-threonylcarbamoyltransferase complex dimerization subunit type 1 TsaB [Candidatus Obscuribacterales bacterium]|nr:tRNA (adenosine(37)-N6)-threonylcarbamoyltransferase complex dimerization subunit type 1 TsaB [Candidatus Obscuribacterales bacterium]
MRILSFDTTNNCVSIALLEDETVVSERLFVSSGGERQESVTLLLPAIDEMLQEASWKKSALDLIAVGIGPGSFTGIRIAVVTARTLAQALNLPLTGVSLLDCYAAKLAEIEGDLPEFSVVLSGGRGHFYFASYKKVDSSANSSCSTVALEEVVAPQHGTLPDLKIALASSNTWAVDSSSIESLSSVSGARAVELPNLANIAAFQGVLACRRVAQRKLKNAASLASTGVSEENGRGALPADTRESLLSDYPYRTVEPLYLRGASVTLKGSDGKATATN